MNFFMVIVICLMGECHSVWQDVSYVSQAECHASAQQAVEYFSTQFPQSDGEIYCMTQAEFDDWKAEMEKGTRPQLQKDHPLYQRVEPKGTDA